MSKAYLTTSQAARLLGVEQHTIQRWANDGLFPGLHVTRGGRRRIPVADVEKLLGDGSGNGSARIAEGKCLLYLRVGSRDDERLLQKGEEHLTNYARQRGYIVTGTAKEIGSGLDGQRPGLQSLRAAIQTGCPGYEAVIVETPDRLLLLGGDEFIRWAASVVKVETAGTSCREADFVYKREWLMELYYPLCDALAFQGIPPARIERAISEGLESIADVLGMFTNVQNAQIAKGAPA